MTRQAITENLKRLYYEFRIPFCLALGWVAIRYFFPETKGLSYVSDFFVALFFLSWFTGNFFRVDRQQAVQQSLGAISDSTNKLETQMAAALDQIQAQANYNPALQPIVQSLTALSTDVNQQIQNIRSANTQVGNLLTEPQPMTFASTDASGKPFSKELYVGLVSNAADPGPVIHVGTSEDLKNKAKEQSGFSSIAKSG